MNRHIFRLYGFHVAAIINIIIGITIWVIFKFPVYPARDWTFIHFTYYTIMTAISLTIIFAIDYCFQYHTKFSKLTFIQYFKNKFYKTYLAWIIVSAIISFEFVINIHTTIKQLIPFINTSRYDSIFAAACQTIHFGINLPLSLSSTYNFLGITTLFDRLYSCWFFLMAFTVAYFIYQNDKIKCDRFITSLFYIYGFGILIGLCFPSFGPFYIYTGHFPANGMPSCLIAQTVLRTIADHVSISDARLGHNVFFGYGLMAMPSLHVAVCFLYVIFFWKEGPTLRCISVIYLLVVFITSMMSGWHYAIDGYAAIPLVYLSIAMSNFTVKTVHNIVNKHRLTSVHQQASTTHP